MPSKNLTTPTISLLIFCLVGSLLYCSAPYREGKKYITYSICDLQHSTDISLDSLGNEVRLSIELLSVPSEPQKDVRVTGDIHYDNNIVSKIKSLYDPDTKVIGGKRVPLKVGAYKTSYRVVIISWLFSPTDPRQGVASCLFKLGKSRPSDYNPIYYEPFYAVNKISKYFNNSFLSGLTKETVNFEICKPREFTIEAVGQSEVTEVLCARIMESSQVFSISTLDINTHTQLNSTIEIGGLNLPTMEEAILNAVKYSLQEGAKLPESFPVEAQLRSRLGNYTVLDSRNFSTITSGNQGLLFARTYPIKLHIKATNPEYYYVETDIELQKGDSKIEIFMSDVGQKVRVNIQDENGIPRTVKIE